MTLLKRHTDVLGGVVGGWNPLVPFEGWRQYSITATYTDPLGLEFPVIRIQKTSGPVTDTIAQVQNRTGTGFVERTWPMGGGLLRGSYPGLAWYFMDPATLAFVAGPLLPIGNVQLGNLDEDAREHTPITNHVLQWFEHTPPTGPYLAVLVSREPSTDAPLWISGHPVEIVADRLTAKGESYEASSATAVQAALGPELQHILPVTSAQATTQDEIDSLALAYGFGIRRSSTSGKVEFVYWREKGAGIAGLPVLDMFSIRADGGPTFDLADSTRITRVRVTAQVVKPWAAGVAMVPEFSTRKFLGIPIGVKMRWRPVPATLGLDKPASGLVIESADVTFDYSTDGVTPDSDIYGVQEAEIDLRGMPGMLNTVDGGASPINLEQWSEGLARLLFDAHSRGRQMATAVGIRGTDFDDALLGERAVIDLDHLPNAQLGQSPTSQRGGQRPFRVISRTIEASGHPVTELADDGTGVQFGIVPEFTIERDDEPGLWLITVTNAAALTAARAQVEFQCRIFAPADTPDFTDPGFRYTIDDATSWPDDPQPIRVGPFPIEHQVHFRLRAFLFGGDASDWSSWDGLGGGSVPGSISSLIVGTPTSSSVALSWTNTNTSALVRVQKKLDTASVWETVIDLPAGSTGYTLTGLIPETDYDVRVVLVSGGVEVGAALTDSFTTDLAANQAQLATPTNAQVFEGWNAVSGVNSPGTYGLEVTAVFGPPDMEIVFEEAIETAPGSGTPGAYSIVLTTPAVVGGVTRYQANAPNDGKLRYLRAYAQASGFLDSDPTTALAADPWASPPTVPDPPSLTIGGMVPTHILPTESFTVPVRRQALFTVPIDNEGVLIIDGVLEAVD